MEILLLHVPEAPGNDYCNMTLKLLDAVAPLASVATIVTVTVPKLLGNLENSRIPDADKVAVAGLPVIE